MLTQLVDIVPPSYDVSVSLMKLPVARRIHLVMFKLHDVPHVKITRQHLVLPLDAVDNFFPAINSLVSF